MDQEYADHVGGWRLPASGIGQETVEPRAERVTPCLALPDYQHAPSIGS